MNNQDKNRHERRKAQLGMSIGAARAILRKQLLFKYLCLAGENVCHSCGAKIDNIDELSIEHIKPWENRDIALYWDLDNIAFSHLRCNKPHAWRVNADMV